MSRWQDLGANGWKAFLRENAGWVTVNTSPQSVGRSLEENCFYRIETDNPYTKDTECIQKASGKVEICECEACSVLGNDVYEWLAVHKALEWLAENLPCASVELVVSPNVYHYADAWIFLPFWDKGCEFLNALSRGVGSLGEKIDSLTMNADEYEVSDVILPSVKFERFVAKDEVEVEAKDDSYAS